MSKREDALAALAGVLAGMASAEFERDAPHGDKLPADKAKVWLEDGDPGEPEITLSPARYSYDHLAELTVEATGAEAEVNAKLDAALVEIASLIDADESLGGVVEYAKASAPQTTEGEGLEGRPAMKGVAVDVLLQYTTTSPLA